FVVLPALPPSPLFPYTTLFRSGDPVGLGGVVERPVVDARLVRAAGRGPLGRPGERGDQVVVDPLVDQDPAGRGAVLAGVEVRRLDRKSTRLNSSHVKISYAVFC